MAGGQTSLQACWMSPTRSTCPRGSTLGTPGTHLCTRYTPVLLQLGEHREEEGQGPGLLQGLATATMPSSCFLEPNEKEDVLLQSAA